MSDLAAPAKKLTKKEKKAQAFRSSKGKGKSKNDVDQAAVPEEDDLDVAEEDREAAKAKAEKAESKKRKRAAEDDAAGGEEEVKEGGEGEEPKKKKRQRGKKQNVQPGVGADGKARLVLFVGNLPYKVTVDDIKKHFAQCGETPAVRLLTPKPSPSSSGAPAKSKGCAFIEFTTSPPLQAALRLHESEFGGRKINVELTAGGGGNSAARTAKIADKRKMMLEEREKVAKNKRAREGKPEEEKPKVRTWGAVAGPVVGEGGEEAKDAGKEELKTRVSVVNGKKVRDRRIPKTDANGVEKERARKSKARADKAASGSNSTPLGQ